MNKPFILKKSSTLKTYINPNIQLGDRVKLIDGSALSCDTHKEDLYIVFSYPALTGSESTIKDMEGIVVEINVQDRILNSRGLSMAYLQDIVVSLGKANFRTCSKFVMKIQNETN